MSHDVIIIGGGPAGLNAAHYLLRAGVRDVTIIERNPECGGLPRFCTHLGWGMLDLRRVLRGPEYAEALVKNASGAKVMTNCAVTSVEAGGRVNVNTPEGQRTLTARCVLLATGIRETPRAARLVSGLRPWGVTTTGAFQEMARYGTLPFKAPLIVGSELVAFSALETARHAGVRPVGLIEERPSLSVPRILGLAAKLRYRVPIHTRARLVEILGRNAVEGAVVSINGVERKLPCDSIVFSGMFRPEATLADGTLIARDVTGTGGPSIDNFFRCSDPQVFAAGNILRGVEHSGFVAREGRDAARAIVQALRGALPTAEHALIVETRGMRYAYPQRIVDTGAPVRIYATTPRASDGEVTASTQGGRILSRRRLNRLPWPRHKLEFSVPKDEAVSRIIVERKAPHP